MASPTRSSGGAWTVDDLQDLPEDGQDYEIFDGSLLVSPHADVFHGAIANRLRRLLDRQAPPGLLVGQDIGVSAKRSSYFVPDLFVAREDALDRGGPALAPAGGGAYREAAALTATDVLRSEQPFPLVLPVGDIF